MTQEVLLTPNPGPQSAFVSCPVLEVFYGGERGGGKTFAILIDWFEHAGQYGENAIGVVFRRTFKQQEELIARYRRYFLKLKCSWRGPPDSTWTHPNGARFRFAYLDNDADAENWQGHELTRIYIEEAGNFPSFSPIQKLLGCLRSGAGVPVGIRLTGNPGGVGHFWLKQRYVDPYPKGFKVITEVQKVFFPEKGLDMEVPLERVFIPAGLKDNPTLPNKDQYIGQLMQVGSEALVRAWLTGDWNVAVGAYFTQFSPRNILTEAFNMDRLPVYLTRFMAIDWGYASPFCVGWYAVSDGKQGLPEGSLIKYREWYGWNGKPNEGMRLPAMEVARKIREYEFGDHIHYRVADPSMFHRTSGPSLAEEMNLAGVRLFAAGNNRTRDSGFSGWDQVRKRLVGDMGIPTLYIHERCVHTIRQLEIVPHDPKNPEDVDTTAEDHAVDELRYACSSRPYRTSEAVRAPTMDEMVAADVITAHSLMEEVQNAKHQIATGYD